MDRADITDIVHRALSEDLGEKGDITSNTVIPVGAVSTANLVARSGGVIAGTGVAARVFEVVDDSVEFSAVADGVTVGPGAEIGRVSGKSRSILTAERTALNLLGRMSGVATATAELVAAVEGTGARITGTRKTMPGLRMIDKYAITAGGGVNHRMGLYDEVMIKDNHIVAAGNIGDAVERARSALGRDVRITVEVETFDQLADTLETDATRVLLDNMDPPTLERAVGIVAGRMETEASGGVTLETVREIAESGVDYISVGWITHSAPQLDIALDFV